MRKKLLCAFLAAIMIMSVVACGKSAEEEGAAPPVTETEVTEEPAEPEEDLPYDYGLGVTFHSDEPVTYSMFFSDASWYPMTEKWITEGVFAKIKERTNVTLDVIPYDSNDYMQNITLDINAGESAYIIPKIYDESVFVDGGAIVPVSDYVQYMPHYQDFVEKYNMQPDLETIIRSDGKYYRLPGMLEAPMQDYTLMIRNDIFKAAGYDVSTLEKDWTWDDLCDILIGVKEYMVKEGMCSESDYIWSDLWAGSESGQGTGGNILNLMGSSYNVRSGWGIGNGMKYDPDTDSWYFSSISDDFKEFITVANRFVEEGILDPETFTQDDTTATNKFYNGETVIISVNRSQYTAFENGLKEIQGEGNYETYVTVYPKGNNEYIAERNRLECGVMLSKRALEELGEDGFIQLIRFVDWLWYSPEAYTLIKWGVEGETFEYAEDPETGKQIKKLLPGFKCSGLGIDGEEDDIDIRLEWGYACGNFWYGHTVEEMSDNFNPVIQDYYARLGEYRKTAPIEPPVVPDEEQNEQLNLWATPLIDNVNSWTLQFIVGQKDIEKDWDAYVESCKALNVDQMVDLINEIYKGS